MTQGTMADEYTPDKADQSCAGAEDRDQQTWKTKNCTLEKAFEVAQEVAREAGQHLRNKQSGVKVVAKKALRDELLDADLEAENIILKTLREQFPDYEILSEETPFERGDTPFRWVVDPLDGSFNFQHGSPTFAVSIGLLVENTMQLAVVYLPFMNEMFTAWQDRGAYCNGKRISVSSQTDLNKAIVHFGDFAKDGNTRDNSERLTDIARLADSVGRVRMIGTAATDLAYVACGRAEAFVVHNALPWDLDIGRLLVTEAGGKVSFHTNTTGKNLAICSNRHIHRQLITAIFGEPQNHFDLERDYGYFCSSYSYD